MALDIRGGLKNTKLSKNPYVVFEELISNAIDSFLIRKYFDQTVANMRIEIEVNLSSSGLFEDVSNMEIICKDNGCGLGDEQLKAFLTKDTSYKDDLSIPGIGKCKGAGRIQYFHYFSGIQIKSIYKIDHQFYKRELEYFDQKEINENNFKTTLCEDATSGTNIKLSQLKESTYQKIINGQELSDFYSADILRKNMLLCFLQRLIGLEEQLGDFEIDFKTIKNKDNIECATLKQDDLPKVTGVESIFVQESNKDTGAYIGSPKSFKISHYKLEAIKFDLPKNSIALCAKSSPVKDINSRYLRSKTEQNNAINGFYHIVMIESEYLDEHVNEQRDDFEGIPEECSYPELPLSENNISYTTIYDAIDPIIRRMVGPADWKKEDVIKVITNHFGISDSMLQDTSTRIQYGDTPQSVAERVLKKYQERVLDETAEIMNLKDEIVKSEPDTDDFREKINNLSWKYTASLKNIDMANLSQIIVRRAAIVEILSLACGKSLVMQAHTEKTRRKDEAIIHSIFFPMRKDSKDVTDHDIWLLSEEYQYYDYISSDMPLSKLKWEDDSNMFSSDIDSEMQDLLSKRSNDNSGKRPDLAIFNKEGSVVIIEFKAPGVNMDEHIGDLSEYSHLLAAKSGGKLKKFYGYLIGDSVNNYRLNGWTKFPLGKGFFQSSPLTDPVNDRNLGETYFEILFFEDVIERAKKRIGVYQNKLNLKLDTNDLDCTP
ncbi:hypothetical protein DKL61_02365 [Gammaproteobacteria bacterium ESL0073]|nr:hypothetical protein DKL61_02365 [Gammaproteobacteria bacterium ESL0073]